MATRTSIGSGLWSAPGTWDTAVPLDSDLCIIASGHTVTFDVDQSGFATGVGVTIQKGAILQASTTAGSYVLKASADLAGSVTGSGAVAQLNAGSAGTPYPTSAQFTLNLNGAHKIDCTNLALNLYCAQPANPFAKLTVAYLSGATTLTVDRNLTGDPLWANGGKLRLDDINKGQGSTEFLIASVSSTTITLAAGAAVAKLIGAYVWLINRNVRVTGSSNSPAVTVPNNAPTQTLNAEFSGHTSPNIVTCTNSLSNGSSFGGTISAAGANGIQFGQGGTPTGWTIGGVISGLSTGINAGSGGGLSTGNTFSGSISGCGTGVSAGYGWILSGLITGCSTGVNTALGCWMCGQILNCAVGISGSLDAVITGTLSNNTTGLQAGTARLLGAVCNNTTDINAVTGGYAYRGYGASLNGATQVGGYTATVLLGWEQVVMWDIGSVADAYKAWMLGGTVVSDTGTLPGVSGITYTFKHAFERSTGPLFTDIPIRLAAGLNRITVYLRQDGTGRAEVPNAQLILPGSDPFYGGAAVASVAMTDTANVWQTLTLSYTSIRAQQALVRLRGLGTSGNFWGQIALAGSGGGMAPIGSSFIKGVH